MNVKKINNVFTQEELKILENNLNYSLIPTDNNFNYLDFNLDAAGEGRGINRQLGRLQFGGLKKLSESIIYKVNNISTESSNKDLVFEHAMSVEYNSLYGSPNLPVHYDHDKNDLIINFQLSSNTKWDIGIDYQVYELEDNSAIVFNGNEYTHWRPHKIFKNGEFIKMIFFRFKDDINKPDYSHLDYTINHEVFAKINEFRDSLRST